MRNPTLAFLIANPRNTVIRTASTFVNSVKSRTVDRQYGETLNLQHYKSQTFETRLFSNFRLDKDAESFDMFCRQCEQAKDGIGCTKVGVCGKTPESSAVQDTLIHLVKCVSSLCVEVRKAGNNTQNLKEANIWTLEATFSTLTNVNFSERSIVEYIRQGISLAGHLNKVLLSKGVEMPIQNALLPEPSMTMIELEDFGKMVGIVKKQAASSDLNCLSLAEIATNGMKGLSAYAAHCYRLGHMDEEAVMEPVHEIWTYLLNDTNVDMSSLLEIVLCVGEINANVLRMLDEAHTSTLGVPEVRQVLTTAVEGKSILVSGHDMLDLYDLLLQTEGTGIHVYTHGEMLPAHSYPKLNSFPHFIGNYGTAWQKQRTEFNDFPGPIIVTSNCIIKPRMKYNDRIYTTNEVAMDGVKHIEKDKDFSPVIQQALQMNGFDQTVEPKTYKEVGYNHRVVVPMAKTIIKAIQSGSLSRVFIIGGCDGTEWNRNYFTDLAEETPDDSIILTLGCAKNRVINSEKLLNAKLDNGLPRVMDIGQCNDSYTAIVIAQELAKALNCDVNELPLSFALSYLEQKSTAVLLTLLSMGVKNIRLGPTPPAFISEDIRDFLEKKFQLKSTQNAKTDLKAMMAGE